MRDIIPADDNLHRPTTEDIYWTETAWFAFSVPERKLTGFFYPVFRTNLSICAAGVYVWDDTGDSDQSILYSHNFWHIPMGEDLDLTRMRLPNGLSYDVLEPLQKYRVRYESKNYNADLIYDGLYKPRLTDSEDHVDQICRVTGVVNLRGEEIPVDCFEMRDKSWHVRSDAPLDLPVELRQGSYSYASNGSAAFLVKAFGDDRNHLSLDKGGFGKGVYWKDGQFGTVVSGRRVVERMSQDGPARRVVVEATDDLGRSFEAIGETYNRFAHRSTPSIWAWISGTNWTVNGESFQGEDQEWTAGANA
jgi:hypothetical protein